MKRQLPTRRLLAGLLALAVLLFVMGCSVFRITAAYPPTPGPVAPASTDTLPPSVTPAPTDTFTPPPPTSPPIPQGTPHFGPITFAGVAADGRVLNPGSQFPTGAREVYAMWDYHNMSACLTIKRVWHRDGVAWLTREERWDYTRHGREGTVTWVKIYDYSKKGLTSGDYRLETFIGDRKQGEASFSVGYRPAELTSTPPPAPPVQIEARGIDGKNLDIRWGPGIQYPVKQSVPPGTVVRILEEQPCTDNTSWYQVQVQDSKVTGWCRSNDLDFWPRQQPYLGPITFGSGVTAAGKVLTPTIQFPAGTQEVYAVWDYSDMSDGLLLRRLWYREGVNWLTHEERWDCTRHGRNGTVTWVKIYDYVKGLNSGHYRLEIYIGNSLQKTASFSVGP